MKTHKIVAATNRSLLSSILLVAYLSTGQLFTVSAQDRYAIERVQNKVREQVLVEQGAAQGTVLFPQNLRAETYPISNVQTSVRGKGIFSRDSYSQPQTFSYEATVNNRSGRVERVSYRFENTSDADGQTDQCAVPRWLRGRFRGQTNSGESELVINGDGSANIRSLRANRTFYGRYSEGILTFDFGSFSVAREGDGIRTLAVNNPTDQTVYARVF
jgi:hypothetical protein